MVGGHIGLEDGSVDGLCRIVLGIGIVRNGRLLRSAGARGATERQADNHRRTQPRLGCSTGDPTNAAIFKRSQFSRFPIGFTARVVRIGLRIFVVLAFAVKATRWQSRSRQVGAVLRNRRIPKDPKRFESLVKARQWLWAATAAAPWALNDLTE